MDDFSRLWISCSGMDDFSADCGYPVQEWMTSADCGYPVQEWMTSADCGYPVQE